MASSSKRVTRSSEVILTCDACAYVRVCVSVSCTVCGHV